MAQIDLKNATLYLRDGSSPTPNELEIKIGEGNLSWTEATTMIYTLDRGILNDVREGDQVPVEVSLDIIWEFLKGDGYLTPRDVLYFEGEASNWESTDADECRPKSLDLVIEYEPPCSGEDNEIIILKDFRKENVAYNLREASLAVTGKCNVTKAIVTREA